MCGILGYLGNRSFSAEAFARALDIMANRGPDDRGIYESPDVLLGHRRLAILDLSPADHQPMASPDGRYAIVYNGEVYNFAELRKPLEAEGVRFASNSDTEVILALYARQGPACLDDFRGMFAIAIWDTLEKTLFLARDRMGIKPLYVWRFPGGLAFASEVKALRALPGGPHEVEPEAVAQYLLWGSVPEPLTIAKGVECLPPATWMLYKAGTITRRTYWEFPGASASLPNTPLSSLDTKHQTPNTFLYSSRDEVLEALRPVLLESVRLRCISDAPLGAFLSGGIDSSSVVSLMRAAGQQHLHTFSISFPQTPLDEAPYALKVAEQFATSHTNIAVSEQMVREELDSFFEAMDQPTCDGVNTYLVSKFAKQGGLTVSLSGLGGDELFAGYPSFQRAHRLVLWLRRVPQPALRVAASAAIGASSRWSKLEFLAQPGTAVGRLYAASFALFTPSQVKRLLHPDFLGRTSLAAGAEHPAQFAPAVPAGLDNLHAPMFLELRRYMHNQLLRDSDVFGMAHSLEIRVPLIDHKIAELLFQTAPEVILAERPKALLMDALPVSLPRACTHRPKMGFTFPFDTWMRGPWRDELEQQFLGNAPASLRTVLRNEELSNCWRHYQEGRFHWSRPWALYALSRSQ
jgi:asparagine synthase (glutamine-hydrolysing)